MTGNRALAIGLLSITGLNVAHPAAYAATLTASEPSLNASTTSAVTTRQPATRWAICGAGEYRFTAAGQPVGTETFDVKCLPDASYSGTGRSSGRSAWT